MIKRRAKKGVGLILAGILIAWIVSPSCNKKKPTNTEPPSPPPPSTPVPVRPPNGSLREAINPLITWLASSDAKTYTLQVATDTGFKGLAVNDSGILHKGFSPIVFPVDSLSKSTQYFWRVKAVNEHGSSNWSAVWSFATGTVEPVGILKNQGNAFAIALQGNYVYMATVDSGLRIIDITNPILPQLVGVYSYPPRAVDSKLAVAGNYVYFVANYPVFKMEIIDISNPAAPFLAGEYPSSTARDIEIEGNYAFLSEVTSMEIIDVSNPSSPTRISTWYIKSDTSWKGSVNTTGGVELEGNHAYLETTYGLDIVNVSNPSSPILTGRFFDAYDHYAGDLTKRGNHIFRTYDGTVLNVSDPANPTLAGKYSSPYEAWYLTSSQIYLYRVGNGLEVVDISNASSPSRVGRYEGVGEVFGLNDLIYGAAGTAGLKILKLTP